MLKTVKFACTEDEARFLLCLMRVRQDDCNRVTVESYHPKIHLLYQDLYCHIEQLKMKLVKQWQ